MKFFFLLGGLAGFAATFAAAVLAGADADLALRDAALGALAGAFLLRWFRARLVSSFTFLLEERAAAVAAAEAEAAVVTDAADAATPTLSPSALPVS